MPVRVLAITSHVGNVVSVRPEAEMLIALSNAGADVTVMVEEETCYVQKFREAGVNVIDYRQRRKFSLSAIRHIRTQLVAGSYDVVYGFNNRVIASIVWAATGLPVRVVTYRGQTGNISRWDPACYLTHLHPRVDGIICVADAVRDDLLRESRLPAERIVTVYKGHQPEWYTDIKPADLGALDIPAGAPVVICVANSRPRKGVPVLVDAFHQLADHGWHLLLVGSGMDSGRIAELIADGPAAGRIHTAGFRDDVLNLVAASRFGVLPTLRREGLPKTVIEVMALGLPAVVTDSGGSKELVVEGDTGHVVPAGDADALAEAMSKLMSDEALCRRMGEAARAHLFRHFTSTQAGRQTLEYFEHLTGKRQ